MIAVYRYALAVPECTVQLPAGARILHFGWQAQREEFSLWALVMTDAKGIDMCTIRIVGTGHPVDAGSDEHIGSVVMPDGFHVFHAFCTARRTVEG